MAYETLEQLPNEVKEKLPQGAQQVFKAAFNSATEDGVNEQDATQIAWNSVRISYQQGSNGQWEPKPQPTTDNAPIGNMGQA
ncbi:ChaB family protein [Gloeothece citriformis PCC 7424]|uniref:ChaB family protein n=1 Tax=Gloeothece citriformis (strain PCC 7424) TaxID=65393 RepID=B7KDG2_GLOC7|nr:ChaB family protein [Gloeothece citriformis]ACK68982.1 ChaB family protein [Gloeothece citriformis PCC 7424]